MFTRLKQFDNILHYYIELGLHKNISLLFFDLIIDIFYTFDQNTVSFC